MASKTSTDVALKAAAEVAEQAQQDLEASLARENQAGLDRTDVQIPRLKIGQAQTVEVTDGDAGQGEFINSLTHEGLGKEVEFVVAGYQKARFDGGDRDKGIPARPAYNTTLVPWSDDPFYQLPFTEHPDAEEQYRERVNRKEIEWGKGPRISTLYVFTGYVVSGLEDGENPIPVALSLKRTDSRAAKNWITILDAVLGGRYWDAVFTLRTEQKRNEKAGGVYYTVNVKQTRKTTAAEKSQAVTLALNLRQQNVEYVGDDEIATPKAAPAAAEGAMEV